MLACLQQVPAVMPAKEPPPINSKRVESDSLGFPRNLIHISATLQGSLTALVTCTDKANIWQGIHSSSGVVEKVHSSHILSNSYVLKLSNFPSFDNSAPASLPSSAACDTPLCSKQGSWLLQFHDTFGSPLLFRLDFNGSTAGVQNAGTLTEAIIFGSMGICFVSETGCSVENGKALVMLVLPAASSCVAVVGELEGMSPEMKALMLSADPCPTKDKLSQTWPGAASDLAVSQQCVNQSLSKPVFENIPKIWALPSSRC
jgi:hypothetical protein